MRYPFDIASFSYGQLDSGTGNPVWRSYIPITSEEDVEEFGEIDVYQGLGLTSVPAPSDDDGGAEGVVLRHCGNTDGVIVGARDQRAAKIYGNLAEGDTCLHATGPDAVAQVQTKANGQVVIYSTDPDGNSMIIAVDGKNGKVQITSGGGLFELDNSAESLSLVTPGGKSSIIAKGETISLVGTIILGGTTPISQVLMAAAPGVPVIGGVSGTGNPAPGVFIGG